MQAIGAVAKRTGLKIPTIRFYEQAGLISPPERTGSGRRLYANADVRRLSFIRHARTLGFELDDIRSLLDLSDHPQRACDDADRIARRHLAEVDIRIEQLSALKTELARIVRSCAGGRASECRVIEALADHPLCNGDHEAKLSKPPTLAKAKRRKAART
jgi:Cu(I)-responsive transcriptional regulator